MFYIVEYKCKKCGYHFTRVFDEEKKASKNEKCANCGDATEINQKFDLDKGGSGCSDCSSCSGGCSTKK